MKRSVAALIVSVFSFGLLVLSSCAHVTPQPGDIVLSGDHRSDYEALSAALGARACVVGELSVDAPGSARFYLEPSERNGVINTGPSRVIVELTREFVSRGRLVGSSQRRVCGILVDATPWRGCDDFRCKWFELREPQLD